MKKLLRNFRIRHLGRANWMAAVVLIVLAACKVLSWWWPICMWAGITAVIFVFCFACETICWLGYHRKIKDRQWMVPFFKWWTVQKFEMRRPMHPLLGFPVVVFLEIEAPQAFDRDGMRGMHLALQGFLNRITHRLDNYIADVRNQHAIAQPEGQ